MQLKRLILQGFKSFADRTEFAFDAPITGIVGPNGCGKSNVVDAFKWVLGEQSARSLRGDAMLDVIFNGSSGRKPAGMAEVVLVFDNPRRADGTRALALDADEVAVGRRLFRDGTSEYRLNNQVGRLKDIRELFLDTGVGADAYSVIEQGKVAAMLDANPEERRAIFEEAAGIARFKQRKREAQRKLEKVDQNLLRVRDIVEEVDRRLRSVRIQAGRARTYREHSDRLRELRLGYALQEYYTHHSQLEELVGAQGRTSAALEESRARLGEAQTEHAAAGHEHEALVQRRQKTETELVQAQSQVQAARQTQQYAAQQLEQTAEQLRQFEADAAALAERRSQQESELAGAREGLQVLDAAVAALGQDIATRQKAFRDAQLALHELGRTIEGHKTAVLDLLRRSAQTANRLGAIEIERRNIANHQQRLGQRRQTVVGELEGLEATRADLAAQLEAARTELADRHARLAAGAQEAEALGRQIAALSRQLATAREHRSGLLSRQKLLRDLEARREGFTEGVKSVLRQRSAKFPFIRGVVADVLGVDVEHAAVIEAALDGRDQMLVADDSAAVAACPHLAALEGRINILCADKLPVPGWLRPGSPGGGPAPVLDVHGRLLDLAPATGVQVGFAVPSRLPAESAAVADEAVAGDADSAQLIVQQDDVILSEAKNPGDEAGEAGSEPLPQQSAESGPAAPALTWTMSAVVTHGAWAMAVAQSTVVDSTITAAEGPTAEVSTSGFDLRAESLDQAEGWPVTVSADWTTPRTVAGGEPVLPALPQTIEEAVSLPFGPADKDLLRRLLTEVAACYDWKRHPQRIRPAVDLVKFQPGDAPIAHHLLGRTIVVESLADARSLREAAPGGFRFVTPAGEVLEADGTLRLGPPTAAMGLISRRAELGAIERQIADVEQQIEALARRVSEGNEQARRLQEVQKELQNAAYQLNARQVELTSRLAQNSDRQSALRRELPVLDKELQNYLDQSGRLRTEEATLTESRARLEAEQKQREQAVQEATARQAQAGDALRQAGEALTALRVELGQAQEKQIAARQQVQRLETSQAELAEQIQRIARSSSQVAQRRVGLEQELAAARQYEQTARERQQALEQVAAQLAEALEAQTARVTAMGAQVSALSAACDEQAAALHQLEMKIGEVRVRLEGLVQRTAEELQLDLPARWIELEQQGGYQPADMDWNAVAEEIRQLREKIQRLGNVNLDAIGEQDELEQRQTFLAAQLGDLTSSKAQLEALIDEINRESLARFEQTFHAVREHFQAMFRKLFGGGRADIFLETSEPAAAPAPAADGQPAPVMRQTVDPLEAGIEIIAHPPGKKPVSISQLSGGEKTMTCVALLMSIFKSKPSPFCILDEVDAALDEANNQRFNLIVQEFLDQSQFIIITHSKRTMQIADTLYGVTMQEQGVSRRVTVRFDEVDNQGRIAPAAAAAPATASAAA